MRSALLILVLMPAVASAGDAEDGTDLWRQKVHALVLAEVRDGATEFMVFLDEQTDLGFASTFESREARGSEVVQALQRTAAETQAPVLALLDRLGVEYRSFWIANMIWVRGDEAALAAAASLGEVRRIDANPTVQLTLPPTEPAGATEETAVTEWGLLKVLAPQVWAMGYDGTGIVIAGQDTGYDWTHPALKAKYRGWNGSSADHSYNWHDSIHTSGGICGPDTTQPCDDHGHGTHTMGTMVGDDGGGNQIGMSPGSTWIACRNMNQGAGTPATYAECFEWFMAPTDLNGNNPDPSKAPHVINNSWTCPPDEGCSANSLKTVVENTRAAGIVVVASAGNAGSGCSSIDAPVAIYDASFTVGASNSVDNLANFSSRGPVNVDGSGRRKPDVAAPGVSVRSCIPGGGYASFSGTSMAGPHVAGLVALLLDARPDLIGKVEAIETLIEAAADPINSAETCGGIPGTEFPNNSYGHGRINALETLVGDADDDGLDNLADCRPADSSVWAPPAPVDDLRLVQDAAFETTLMDWSEPAGAGASALRYDLLRSEKADDFASAICLTSFEVSSAASDGDDPPVAYYYLVRIRNACADSLGAGSNGGSREGVVCLTPDGF